jgi:hypothetical protein
MLPQHGDVSKGKFEFAIDAIIIRRIAHGQKVLGLPEIGNEAFA